MIQAPFLATVLMTGNNLSFLDDNARRVVPIDLDPRCEFPEDRRFKRANLLEFVRGNRARCVSAALTVLRAFIVAERPQHASPRFGGFEDWDALVRSACIWVGLPDPISTVARIREERDVEREQLGRVLEAWDATWGNKPHKAEDAVALESGDLFDALKALWDDGKPNARRVGNWIRRRAGQIVDGLKFESTGRGKVKSWRVVHVGEPDPHTDPPQPEPEQLEVGGVR